jgi:hypothetical protein
MPRIDIGGGDWRVGAVVRLGQGAAAPQTARGGAGAHASAVALVLLERRVAAPETIQAPPDPEPLAVTAVRTPRRRAVAAARNQRENAVSEDTRIHICGLGGRQSAESSTKCQEENGEGRLILVFASSLWAGKREPNGAASRMPGNLIPGPDEAGVRVAPAAL